MLRSIVTAAAVLTTVGLVAGCGDGFDRDAAVASFQRANPDVGETQAECVVDRQIDRLGLDGLATELEASPPSDAFVDAQFRDMFACGVDGDVEQQLVEQLEANGVPPEVAPCVAGRLVDQLDDDGLDVLVSGEITDDFMASFVSAMEDCDAVSSGSGG